MANAIALFKKYVALLDEVYKGASCSSVLDIDGTLVREGANANEIIIPKMSMDGLADYSRNSGYVQGNVEITNQTVTFNYDRGRKFNVDAMDNVESAGLAFGKLASEFIRTQVVPELDAFRFAAYSAVTGIGSKASALATGEDVIAAIREGVNAMDEAEVPATNRYLFITPTLHSAAQDVNTYISKAALADFAGIIKVPQARFYTAIDLHDGTTSGETAGGFKKAAAGKDINFMIIHKPAVVQYSKHTVSKVIAPDDNIDADAYVFAYRAYGLTDAYENKAAGIYLNHKS